MSSEMGWGSELRTLLGKTTGAERRWRRAARLSSSPSAEVPTQ